MTRKDDPQETQPTRNPFIDEPVPAPLPRLKKQRPAGIMSAGGVDMARAYATDIHVRAAQPERPLAEERVVVSVETDPRRVQTERRLVDPREPTDDGTRAALLPGAPGPASPPPDTSGSANATLLSAGDRFRTRAAWAAVAILLGIFLTALAMTGRVHQGPSDLPSLTPASTALVVDPILPSAGATSMASPLTTGVLAPQPSPSVNVSGSHAPVASAVPPVSRPGRLPSGNGTRPGFTPPFELPGEKKK